MKISKFTKKIICFFSAAAFAFSFTSCGEVSDGSGGEIYTVISENPQNLDPQLATDSPSLSVIRNIYECLTAVSENGEIHCSAAESCVVSEDKLTYTFKLRDNIYWNNIGGFNDAVNADDFVFAFQRIFDPDIQSPYVRTFAALKNSEAVYNGVLAPSDLGVKAPDSGTVVFTLDYPVSDFLYLLSTAPASPCCRSFYYSTGGRYGLSAEYTACSGAFYLSEWNYDPYWNENFLTLRRNSANSSEERRIYPSTVHYIITNDVAEYEEASGNTVNVRICKAGSLPRMKGKKAAEYPCIAAGVTFNGKDPIFANQNIRKSLSLCTDITVYEGKTSKGIEPGSGTVPYAVTVEGKPLRELFGEVTAAGEGAKELWDKGLAETGGNYPELETIIISDDLPDAQIVYMITDSWNEELGFSCGAEILDSDEYDRRIAEGDYSIALTTITSSASPAADFLDEYKPYIIGNDVIERFAALTGSARYNNSVSDELRCCREAERLLMDSASYIPVFYESKLLVTENGVSDVIFDPFAETFDFRNAKIR